MKISDELLMAYADGELSPEQCAEVERALQQDVRLADQVARHRKLRQRLREAMAPGLDEAVPDRLRQALQASAAKPRSAVVDLDARRMPARKSWGLHEWSAMAACLVAGVGLGLYLLNFDSGGVVMRDGVVLASRSLASALDEQLASAQNEADVVQIGLSFRDREGHYCRTFNLRQNSAAGLACKQGGSWRVELLAAGDASGAEYRQAGSSTPTAVLALIERKIQGEPLDESAEAAARAGDWTLAR